MLLFDFNASKQTSVCFVLVWRSICPITHLHHCIHGNGRICFDSVHGLEHIFFTRLGAHAQFFTSNPNMNTFCESSVAGCTPNTMDAKTTVVTSELATPSVARWAEGIAAWPTTFCTSFDMCTVTSNNKCSMATRTSICKACFSCR